MNLKKILVVVGCFTALGVCGWNWFGDYLTGLLPASASGAHGAAADEASSASSSTTPQFRLDPVEVPGLGLGAAADRRWIAYYYRNPKPEEMPVVLGRIAEAAKSSDAAHIGANAQFFAAILRQHPELKAKVEEQRAAAKEGGAEFYSRVEEALKRPAANPAKTVEDVQGLWAEYCATGDPAKIDGMLAVGELIETAENREIQNETAKFVIENSPYSANLFTAVHVAARTSDGAALDWINYLVNIQNRNLSSIVDNSVSTGCNLVRQRNLAGGFEQIKRAYRVFPDSARLQRTLGWMACEAHQYEAARDAYQKAVAIYPDSSEYWYCLGMAQMDLRDFASSAGSYEQAMKLGYADPGVWHAAARAYQEKGDHETAVRYFKKYLSLEPHGPNEGLVKNYLAQRGVKIEEDPEDLSTLLLRRDYPKLEEKMAAILQEKKFDESGCSLISQAYDRLCTNPGRRQGFDAFLGRFQQWAAQRPNSHFARACYGIVLIDHAWHARGSGWANTVTSQGWKSFEERLKQAQEELEKAYASDSSDPIPPSHLITVAMGLGLENPEMEKQFQRGIAASPQEYGLFSRKMLYLAPKWHGSEEQMLAFARETAQKAPSGAITPMILADTHWELFESDENDPRYFRKEGVWPELKQAYTKVCGAYPKALYRINGFAMAAFYAGDYQTASEQIQRLGSQWETLYPNDLDFRRKVKAVVQRRLGQSAASAQVN